MIPNDYIFQTSVLRTLKKAIPKSQTYLSATQVLIKLNILNLQLLIPFIIIFKNVDKVRELFTSLIEVSQFWKVWSDQKYSYYFSEKIITFSSQLTIIIVNLILYIHEYPSMMKNYDSFITIITNVTIIIITFYSSQLTE